MIKFQDYMKKNFELNCWDIPFALNQCNTGSNEQGLNGNSHLSNDLGLNFCLRNDQKLSLKRNFYVRAKIKFEMIISI